MFQWSPCEVTILTGEMDAANPLEAMRPEEKLCFQARAVREADKEPSN